MNSFAGWQKFVRVRQTNYATSGQWPESSEHWPLITDHLSQHSIYVANGDNVVLVAAMPLQENRGMFLERLPEPMRHAGYGFSKYGDILVCMGGA